ncbi:MAG TPA: T9SS type A sorting domain-containing protein, partial [Flavobacteriales bacterium]|nr:T9SS type A sorting domain-containing protein [Flavobacteriales bacterium]
DTDLLWCTACGAVVLYDQLGRRILFDRRNSSGTTLDLSSLNDGVYLVVEDVQGHAKAHRFVKY